MEPFPPSSDARADEGWHDLTLSIDELLQEAGRWLLYMTIGTLGLHLVLWGLPDWPTDMTFIGLLQATILYLAAFLAIYIVSAVAHEGLHALAMLVVARVSWRSIRFGMRLHEGVAYVHTSTPMTVRAYRVVLVLPGLVLGLIPALAGLALGNGYLTVYGFVMLASAIGDIVMLIRLRPYAPHLMVRDHPSDIGCQVFGSGV